MPSLILQYEDNQREPDTRASKGKEKKRKAKMKSQGKMRIQDIQKDFLFMNQCKEKGASKGQ